MIQTTIESLTALQHEGYLTLQIPQLEISMPTDPDAIRHIFPTITREQAETMAAQAARVPVETPVEIPESHICQLKFAGRKKTPHHANSYRFCLGREQGYTYWSQSGYEAMKPQIRAAWLEAHHKHRTRYVSSEATDEEAWAYFEAHSHEHFDLLEEKTRRHAERLRRKAEQAASLSA